MSQTSPVTSQSSQADPNRPRFLGLWIGLVLAVTLFGGAISVIADMIYRDLVRNGVIPGLPS